jgi:hypothetical protein
MEARIQTASLSPSDVASCSQKVARNSTGRKDEKTPLQENDPSHILITVEERAMRNPPIRIKLDVELAKQKTYLAENDHVANIPSSAPSSMHGWKPEKPANV